MSKHSTYITNDFNVDAVSFIDGSKAEVGKNGVSEIVYHTPLGEGDRHFVDIVCGNRVYRNFQFEELTWEDNESRV